MKKVVLAGLSLAHAHVLQSWSVHPLAASQVHVVCAPTMVHPGMLPALVDGRVTLDAAAIDCASLVRSGSTRATWVNARIAELDLSRSVLGLSDGREIPFQLLSIDGGGRSERDRIDGAREHALFVRPAESFIAWLPSLLELAERRAINLVVVGGGAEAIELALAFASRLARVGDGGSRVALVTAGAELPDGWPRDVRVLVERALRRRGVTIFRDRCVRIQRGQVHLESGARLACDAPVVAGGHSAPTWALRAGLAADEEGLLKVDEHLRSLSHPHVLVSADIAAIAGGPAAGLRPGRAGTRTARAWRSGAVLQANLRSLATGGDSSAMLRMATERRGAALIDTAGGRGIYGLGAFAVAGRWAGARRAHADSAVIAQLHAAGAVPARADADLAPPARSL